MPGTHSLALPLSSGPAPLLCPRGSGASAPSRSTKLMPRKLLGYYCLHSEDGKRASGSNQRGSPLPPLSLARGALI